MMTGPREAVLLRAVDLLLAGRRGEPIDALPAELIPAGDEEIAFVQDRIAEAFGGLSAWKVGASGPEMTPSAAPIPRPWVGFAGTTVSGPRQRLRGVEAEIAFRLGTDLPPRAGGYTRDDIHTAIASCHPAIELLESAFVKTENPELKISKQADLAVTGGLILGSAYADWQRVDLTAERVSVAIDGVIRTERTGSNPAGDPIRLLLWLANEASARTGGLLAGQYITTGSWTGADYAFADSAVDIHFHTFGRVSFRFG